MLESSIGTCVARAVHTRVLRKSTALDSKVGQSEVGDQMLGVPFASPPTFRSDSEIRPPQVFADPMALRSRNGIKPRIVDRCWITDHLTCHSFWVKFVLQTDLLQ